MPNNNPIITDEEKALFASPLAGLELSQLAEKAVDKAFKQIDACWEFKKSRLARLALYWDLYNGKIPKKMRRLFHTNLPIFPGMIDTLNAQYDTPVRMKFGEQDPGDYFKVEKIQGAFDQQVLDSAQNNKWDDKLRTGRKHAIMNGRAILEYNVTSDPEYDSELINIPLKDFVFQPKGGKYIENHLFAGRENIRRTEDEIKKKALSDDYERDQVRKLLARSSDRDYHPEDYHDHETSYSRFKPLGLDTQNSSYVGTAVYSLVHMILEMDGERYYLLFDPWTKVWLRFQKWIEIEESGEYPWVTYATHDDDENFLSKSYADDLFASADSILALFNQELTNREKRNNSPRAFDQDMFTDVKKLDEASYRSDALVPVDTKNGTRRISDGIYEFKSGDLGGTINLVDWISSTVGRSTAVNDLSQGSVQSASKKASVTFAEQKSVSKRLGWGAQPFQSMMADLGKKFIWGLKQHMPSKMAIKKLGEKGLDWDEITRLDLRTNKDVDVIIVSSEQEQEKNELAAEKKKEALTLLLNSPNINSKKRDEEILRYGGWEDNEIAEFLDNVTYSDKKSVAMADAAIQDCLDDKKLDVWYGATIAFIQRIIDFSSERRSQIGMEKYKKLLDYAVSHKDIARDNIKRTVAEEFRSQTATPGEPGAVPQAPQQAPQQNKGSGIPGGIQHAMNIAENNS